MLTRDARHHALADVGAAGQDRIAAATALLIGVGGIGCAAATYLASSGVGRILLVDFDTVDESNLARQFLYTPSDVGKRKAEVAAKRLREMHPEIVVDAVTERASRDSLDGWLHNVDIVLDGCDNFSTRFDVNEACVAQQKTLIAGSAIRMEGQCAVFGPDYAQSACYRCLYTESDESLDSCAGQGVLSAVPGTIGCLMAVETLKILAGIDVSASRLTLFDARSFDFRAVKIKKNPHCDACSDV